MSEPKTVCAIVLSYARPENLRRVLEPVLACGAVAHVIVGSNNPSVDLTAHLDEHERVAVRREVIRYPAWKRFEHAAHSPFAYFIAIDDDVFLRRNQVESLVACLLEDSTVPHGLAGQRLLRRNGELVLKGGFSNSECELDVLNQVYAFSRLHAERVFVLLELLAKNHCATVGPIDDILLSFAGPSSPRCHDLGPIERCPTSDAPDRALWRTPGFHAIRNETVRDLLGLHQRIPWLHPRRLSGLVDVRA